MKRDLSIDFYRGLGVISVIFIHTVFWSGQEYTPQILKSFVLLLDVPFFFFISGQTARLQKKSEKIIKGLMVLWEKWIFFLFFTEGVCLIFRLEGILNFRDLVNNVFFLVSIPGFPVIKGSIWFLRVYFKVIFIVTIFMIVLKKIFDEETIDTYIRYSMALCFLGLVIQAVYDSTDDRLSYLLFYIFFYLFGYVTLKTQLNGRQFAVLLIVTVAVMKLSAYIFGKSLVNLQDVKFPPHVVYLFASLFGIWLALFFKNKIKYGIVGKMVLWVGQQSIWFYFAQGISSSLLYSLEAKMEIKYWFVKLGVFFGTNLVMAVMLAFLLSNGWSLLQRIAGLVNEKVSP